MLPESVNKSIDEMKDTEDKQLLNILKEKGAPYVRRHDGYAVKMDEDVQIEYKDWEENERTLKVPSGSYIVTNADCNNPMIMTADDWESKNKFFGDEKPNKEKKNDNSPKIGMELMADESDTNG